MLRWLKTVVVSDVEKAHVMRRWGSERRCDALKPSGKPFEITKWEVWEARGGGGAKGPGHLWWCSSDQPGAALLGGVAWTYRQVKANRGAPGVDGVTLEVFDKDLKNNLYKIWSASSRAGGVAMSSG